MSEYAKEAEAEIERLERELAEARELLRDGRCYVAWKDAGGLRPLEHEKELLRRIDAFLAGDRKKVPQLVGQDAEVMRESLRDGGLK
jgi:hypothetical protein